MPSQDLGGPTGHAGWGLGHTGFCLAWPAANCVGFSFLGLSLPICKMDLRLKTPVALTFYGPMMPNLLLQNSKRPSAPFLSLGRACGGEEVPGAVEVGEGRGVWEFEYFQQSAWQEGGLARITVIVSLSAPCRGPLNVLPSWQLPAWRGVLARLGKRCDP